MQEKKNTSLDCMHNAFPFFQTLHTFDEFADFEHEDPLVSMMRQRIGEMGDPNVSKIFSFIKRLRRSVSSD